MNFTPKELAYWGTEFRRLRIGHLTELTLHDFMTMDELARQAVQAYCARQLYEWRCSPRTMCHHHWIVLDWQTNDPKDAEVGMGWVDITGAFYPN